MAASNIETDVADSSTASNRARLADNVSGTTLSFIIGAASDPIGDTRTRYGSQMNRTVCVERTANMLSATHDDRA
jgi:hypothetical protein